ncbi:MAG: exosortase O, partial [Anaerolineae bacterium]
MVPFLRLAALRRDRSAFQSLLFYWSVNAVIVAFWLWLYHPVFDYLGTIFTAEDFRTNQIVLVAVIVLIIYQVRRGSWALRLDLTPQLCLPALAIALGSSFLYLAVERFLDINTISASLFGLASYGLLGLWMERHAWRQGLPAVLLLVGTLPFGEHLQTFVGYPLRILTATIVRDGLNAAGIASAGVDTILRLENGVSQVDLPCSGVKSIWTGLLFLIAATWLERRALGVRWLMVACALGVLLLLTNILRVGVLVVVGQILDSQIGAEIIHVPLGVLGFVAACAGAFVLLRRLPSIADATRATTLLARPAWLFPTLAAAILILGLLYAPRQPVGLVAPVPKWQLPSDLMAEVLPLSSREVDWFRGDGAESAERWSFGWRGLTGSMMLITSSTWRAQHRPERCFEVFGLTLEDSATQLISPDFPIRRVSLGQRDQPHLYQAAYWFQSATRTTDDYGTRLWADLSPVRSRWVLVTLLFDGSPDPGDSRPL